MQKKILAILISATFTLVGCNSSDNENNTQTNPPVITPQPEGENGIQPEPPVPDPEDDIIINSTDYQLSLDTAKTMIFANASFYGKGHESHWHNKNTIVGFGYKNQTSDKDGVGWFIEIPEKTELELTALVENTFIQEDGSNGGMLRVEVFDAEDLMRNKLISGIDAQWKVYAKKDNSKDNWGLVEDKLGTVTIPNAGKYLIILRAVQNGSNPNGEIYERNVSMLAEMKLTGKYAENIEQLKIPETRGRYFTWKKEYIPEDLPTFESSKDKLPKPILDGNPEWVNLYWNTWKFAFEQLRTVKATNTTFVSNYIDEAFSNDLFQWDIQMMIEFWKYSNETFNAIATQDNFYRAQNYNGMIHRMLNEITGDDHGQNDAQQTNPPIFAWAELNWATITGDKTRFEHVIPAIAKQLEYIENAHAEPKNKKDKHFLYWNNGQGNGLDSLPRANGPYETKDVGSVDMSVQVANEYFSLAKMSEMIGNENDANRFREKGLFIAEKINQLWDDNANFYVDINSDKSTFLDKATGEPVLTLAGSWPLLFGDEIISDNSIRAGLMVEKLFSPDYFFEPFPLPVLSKNHSQYTPGEYDMGGVMTPTAMITMAGLRKQGYIHEASVLGEKILNAVNEIFRGGTHYWGNHVLTYPEWKDKRICTIWEMYKPTKSLDNHGGIWDTNEEIYYHNGAENGSRSVRPQFVGWSGIYPINTLIDHVIGLEANALENQITWNLRRTDRHGIEQFKVGDTFVDLIANERNVGDAVTITAKSSNKDIKLTVKHLQDDSDNSSVVKKTITLKAGQPITFTVKGSGIASAKHSYPVYDSSRFKLNENCANYSDLIKENYPIM
ncbi:MGH1-like glycoside hydrolase domain-containing protein [Photobacterium damselae]|uniref:MGH1-like glycoside hydrolase domain-containing protein n=1 Tax=Photobacterium damselae TaxID=38293 RepID=UPI002542AC7E|nr:hypothetical protein [Photobacterium damselae]WIH20671.1 hypothetical protein KQY33_07275 [Photobacterium damselae]